MVGKHAAGRWVPAKFKLSENEVTAYGERWIYITFWKVVKEWWLSENELCCLKKPINKHWSKASQKFPKIWLTIFSCPTAICAKHKFGDECMIAWFEPSTFWGTIQIWKLDIIRYWLIALIGDQIMTTHSSTENLTKIHNPMCKKNRCWAIKKKTGRHKQK